MRGIGPDALQRGDKIPIGQAPNVQGELLDDLACSMMPPPTTEHIIRYTLGPRED